MNSSKKLPPQEKIGVVWLEDESETVIHNHLTNGGGFDVFKTHLGHEAVNRLREDPSRRIFLVDLIVPDIEPIHVAIQARHTKQEVPCYALSHYIVQSPTAEGLTTIRAEGLDPFVRYRMKDTLASFQDREDFVRELRILADYHLFEGTVIEWDSDSAKVTLEGEGGKPYDRVFESEILTKAGVKGIGDEVKVLFRRSIEGRGASLCMDIWVPEQEERAQAFDAARFIDENLDLAKLEEWERKRDE